VGNGSFPGVEAAGA